MWIIGPRGEYSTKTERTVGEQKDRIREHSVNFGGDSTSCINVACMVLVCIREQVN
jgi:hypothetical protein